MLKNLINKILLGNTQIAGMRTILLNTIVLILAVWEFAVKDGGLFAFLCSVGETVSWLSFFCEISSTAFYSSALVFITALNNVLRWLSDTPVGVNPKNVPARMQFRATEIPGANTAIIACAVGVSIISIIGLVIAGIL